MTRVEIRELHFIAPIANVPSILKHGILSHQQADKLKHTTVAMPEVQERRKNKQIPGARALHEYANLYFDAHNPMLSKRRDQNNEICVLRVDQSVLDIPGAILADCNAASQYVRFLKSPDGLSKLNGELIFAQYWTNSDPIKAWEHKSAKCAEILIPDRIVPSFIVGAYVANNVALAAFNALNIELSVTINGAMFF